MVLNGTDLNLILFQMGAALEEVDSIGQTPLFYAVCHQFAVELITILIDRGANPKHERKSKYSRLFPDYKAVLTEIFAMTATILS